MTNENSTLTDLRFRREVAQLHRLGARTVCELLEHLGRKHLIRTSIESELRRFAALDPKAIRALGADRFPNHPLRIVSNRGDSP